MNHELDDLWFLREGCIEYHSCVVLLLLNDDMMSGRILEMRRIEDCIFGTAEKEQDSS